MYNVQTRSSFAAAWRRLATVSAAATLTACVATIALPANAVRGQPPTASGAPPAGDPPPATPVQVSAEAGQDDPGDGAPQADRQRAPAAAAASSDGDKSSDGDNTAVAPAEAPPEQPAQQSEEERWTALFDGQTLDGWVQRGGRAKFSVQRGELVGATRLGTADSFLCTEARFANFELELEFKVDPRINAGVQFRSRSDPEYEAGAVYGYQAEIDPTERGWTGGIYDQARRGWLVSLEKRPDARAAFKPEQWNTLRIRADGPRIATWINGVPAAELEDDRTASGFIAMQIHRTDLAESREVRWRNIRLRTIDH